MISRSLLHHGYVTDKLLVGRSLLAHVVRHGQVHWLTILGLLDGIIEVRDRLGLVTYPRVNCVHLHHVGHGALYVGQICVERRSAHCRRRCLHLLSRCGQLTALLRRRAVAAIHCLVVDVGRRKRVANERVDHRIASHNWRSPSVKIVRPGVAIVWWIGGGSS